MIFLVWQNLFSRVKKKLNARDILWTPISELYLFVWKYVREFEVWLRLAVEADSSIMNECHKTVAMRWATTSPASRRWGAPEVRPRCAQAVPARKRALHAAEESWGALRRAEERDSGVPRPSLFLPHKPSRKATFLKTIDVFFHNSPDSYSSYPLKIQE